MERFGPVELESKSSTRALRGVIVELPGSVRSHRCDPDKTLANAYGVWGEKDNYGKKYMGIIRSSFLVGPDGLIKKAYRKVRVDGHVSAILEDAKTYL